MAIPTRLQSTLRRERVNGKLTPWGKFAQHRRDAKGRGIVFALTFEQWCGIWERSGKWNKRGARRGQYVMARDGDRGPYAIGNVRILPCEQNHSESAFD